MSKTLCLVNEQLVKFRNGETNLTEMWVKIDSGLVALRGVEEDAVDPYEDDKDIRRTQPRSLIG